MIRALLSLILVWGILGVPALCMAGELLHGCECGDAISCAHEDECSDDPCSDELALRGSGTGDVDDAPLPADFRLTPSAGASVPLRTAESSLLPNLPFPPSQRPLLI